MEMTLITIVLLLIGAFNLAILGAQFIILTKLLNSPSLKTVVNNNPGPAPQPKNATDEELARRKKKAYEDQLEAINEMLNYNSDIAYGIKPKDEY